MGKVLTKVHEEISQDQESGSEKRKAESLLQGLDKSQRI